eukprot:UN04832
MAECSAYDGTQEHGWMCESDIDIDNCGQNLLGASFSDYADVMVVECKYNSNWTANDIDYDNDGYLNRLEDFPFEPFKNPGGQELKERDCRKN